MDLSNSRTLVLLILLCVTAALLGAASSYLFLGFNESDNSGGSEELHISTDLINDDLSLLLEDLEDTYPDDVIIGSDEVVLSGSEVIGEFDSVYFTDELEFNWDSLENQEAYITYIVDVDDIRYSQDISDYYRMNAAVEELHFSNSLINDEINVTLNKINETYPGSVCISGDGVVILESEAYTEFDTYYFGNELTFNWDSNSSDEQKVILMLKDGDYILHSADITELYREGRYDPFLSDLYGTDFVAGNDQGSIMITYEELENLLNGDNDTVQYFQEMLDMYHEMQNDETHNHR